jgi:hypothetical protein
LTVNVNGGGSAGTPSMYFWSGTFKSADNSINAADSDIIVNNENTYCSRSGTSLSCLTPVGEEGSITISGYYKNAGTSLWICAANFPSVPINSDPGGAFKSATLSWTLEDSSYTNVLLSIEKASCP